MGVLHVCLCTMCISCAQSAQKRALNFLELELQLAIATMWESSERAASASNH